MVGTLWKSESGIAYAQNTKMDSILSYTLDNPDCFAHISESSYTTYYTQLTQPTEET